MCISCGLPFVSKQTKDHLCGHCHSQSMPFHMARSAGSYEGALRTLIHHFKFQGCVQLAGPLGRLLWWSYLTHWRPDQVDLIVPVPLHPKRMRQRGFNQAHQLVRQWPKYARSDGVLVEASIEVNVLHRRRPTLPQTGLDRRRREANVADAFSLDQKDAVAGRRVLVVDDVLTTGATIKACARLLRKAGAVRVDVLTLARAI
jgi:ComF family protein